MVSHMPHPDAASAAARRQPILLPGFDRQIQLTLEFRTIPFGAIWLRRAYTNEQDPSIRVRLAAEDIPTRDFRLQQVRYGNNITLALKACYNCRKFYHSNYFWTAISRGFSAKPETVKAVIDLFIKARNVYLSTTAPHSSSPLTTGATYWADRWASFLNEPQHAIPTLASDVFGAFDDFFKREKGRSGDVACILSKPPPIDTPPPAPRAPRKRSLSPSAPQWTPSAKRRTFSRTTDESFHGSTPGSMQASPMVIESQTLSHPRQELPETVAGANGRQGQDDEVCWTTHEEPYVGLKIRGQAQKLDTQTSPSRRDHYFAADQHEVLEQANGELQHRVDFLEKEKMETATAQKDWDEAIRALQAKFATFERRSATVNAQPPVNDKLVAEMTKKIEFQGEKLQKMEKELACSSKTTQEMQATISSLQKMVAAQSQPPNQGTLTQGPQTEAVNVESGIKDTATPTIQKNEVSDMQVRVSSLEAKIVFLNCLHKDVRELKAEIAAQKKKAPAPAHKPAQELNDQDTSSRLKAVEEGTERHVQMAKITERVGVLEEQVIVSIHARIATLESRPDPAEDIPKLLSKVSAAEQNHTSDIRALDIMLTAIQTSFEKMQTNIKELSKRFDEMGGLPLIKTLVDNVAETKVSLVRVGELSFDTSKRLEKLEKSHDALELQEQSSRLDGMTNSIQFLQTSVLSLAEVHGVEALRAELSAVSEKQNPASQQKTHDENVSAALTGAIDDLSTRMTSLDQACEQFAAETRTKLEQHSRTFWTSVQDSRLDDVSAVVNSLCQRVGIIENGFRAMRDVMTSRRS